MIRLTFPKNPHKRGKNEKWNEKKKAFGEGFLYTGELCREGFRMLSVYKGSLLRWSFIRSFSVPSLLVQMTSN